MSARRKCKFDRDAIINTSFSQIVVFLFLNIREFPKWNGYPNKGSFSKFPTPVSWIKCGGKRLIQRWFNGEQMPRRVAWAGAFKITECFQRISIQFVE